MAFFGIYMFGPEYFLKESIRKDYKEPKDDSEVEACLQKVEALSSCPATFQRPTTDIDREIDIYLGRVNGFSYGSLHRFNKLKIKRIIKPVGPSDIYRKPPTRQMEYGWFLCDPDLQGKTWYKPVCKYPIIASPASRILDIAKRNNKYANLYN